MASHFKHFLIREYEYYFVISFSINFSVSSLSVNLSPFLSLSLGFTDEDEAKKIRDAGILAALNVKQCIVHRNPDDSNSSR